MIETRKFHSSSSSKEYTAQRDTVTGETSCDCPGWKFQRTGQARGCKHTREWAAETAKSVDGSTTLAKVAAVSRKTKAAPVPADRTKPMLASAMIDGATLDDFTGAEWVLEEKYDGHRVMVRVTGGESNRSATAWSRPRSGAEPLARELPPHVLAAVRQLPIGVYDGELVLAGGTSSDVTRLDQQANLQLVIFDVLESMGLSVLGAPYRERREFLKLAVCHYQPANANDFTLAIPHPVPVSLDAVRAIWNRGGEGAIVKRLTSPYRPGWRSPDWVKVKRHASAQLIITGFVAGKCGPFSVAALRADDGRETTVKTLDNATRAAITSNPDSYIGRRLVIAYTEHTSKGSFRHGTWDHLIDADHAAWDSGERRSYAVSPAVAALTQAADSPRSTPATAPPSTEPSVPSASAPAEASGAPIGPGRKVTDWRAAGLKAAETRRRRLADAATAGGAA